MLSSISQYVRMLDGRDRGQVVEVNREIALDLIERQQATEVDVTAKNALDPWDDAQLAQFRQGLAIGLAVAAEHEIQAPVAEVEARSEAVEVSTPRAKTKRR